MCHIVPICHFSVDLVFSHTLCHIICICVVSILCHIILIYVELKFITHTRSEVYHTSGVEAYHTCTHLSLSHKHAECSIMYFTLLLL